MAAITTEEMQAEVQRAIDYGGPVRFRFFSGSIPAGSYDDDIVLSSPVNVWTSGLSQPVNKIKSSNQFLKEQGRVEKGDIKLYVLSTVTLSGIWRVGIGSPCGQEFAPVAEGIIPYTLGNTTVYYKAYLKALPTGSLYGE